MKINKTPLNDCLIIEPDVFGDDRGFFLETYHYDKYKSMAGIDLNFVQDNHSRSSKGVLRGLHYQLDPFAQGKLVRVITGEVFDVAVDIRVNSKNFGKWFGAKLSADNKKQLWIPRGFAHGFLTLSDSAEFLYKTTNFYNKNSERSIIWNDPDINIDWGSELRPIVSLKDKNAPFLKDADFFI